MFSGIVQCMATVADINVVRGGLRMRMHARSPVGASVAHSGACMTVVRRQLLAKRAEYVIDISLESLGKTTWAVGRLVRKSIWKPV